MRLMNLPALRVRKLSWLLLALLGLSYSPLQAAKANTLPTDVPSNEILKQTSRGFHQVAAKAIPAVVCIEVEGERSPSPSRRFGDWPPLDDDFLRRFFGMPPFTQRQPFTGFGSGALIRSDGYIITNYHVVRGASKIKVTLADDSQHTATLIGSDPDTDLAIIKIEGKDLPHLSFGDSDNLQIGEWVIAIGAPQSLRSSVTVGVVSAKGRTNLELNTIEEFIQSDVVVNLGNSGGPLLNVDGEIVGVNSAILTNDGTYMGISFAIPSSIARTVADQIIQNGSVRRGFMGIRLKPVNEEIAAAYGLEKPQGVVITDVVKDSPAEKAGLKFGDVILAVDGQEIRDAKALHRALWLKQPGKTVRLSINREGQLQTINIKLEALPQIAEESSSHDLFGMKLGLSHEESFNTKGPKIVIQDVRPDSPAFRAGIQPGMQLVGINRKRPQSLDEAVELLKQAQQKGKVLLLVEKGNHSAFIMLQTGS